jgi:hypothetical protein
VEPTDETILHRWKPVGDDDVQGMASLAAVPAANAFVYALCGNEDAGLSGLVSYNLLSVLDTRQAAESLKQGAACPPIMDLFSPPDSSVPMVLAGPSPSQSAVAPVMAGSMLTDCLCFCSVEHGLCSVTRPADAG